MKVSGGKSKLAYNLVTLISNYCSGIEIFANIFRYFSAYKNASDMINDLKAEKIHGK